METIGRDLAEMQRVPLAASHVAALRRVGTVLDFAAGDLLARPGDRADRFLYVEEGEVEVVDPLTGERKLPSTLGPTQFMGEVALLSGGTWSMPMRAVRPTRVLAVPRVELSRLMAETPETSDIVITVLAAPPPSAWRTTPRSCCSARSAAIRLPLHRPMMPKCACEATLRRARTCSTAAIRRMPG